MGEGRSSERIIPWECMPRSQLLYVIRHWTCQILHRGDAQGVPLPADVCCLARLLCTWVPMRSPPPAPARAPALPPCSRSGGGSSYLGGCYQEGWEQQRSCTRVNLTQNASGSAGLLLASIIRSCHCCRNRRNNDKGWLLPLKTEKFRILNHIFLGCYLACQVVLTCQPSAQGLL